MPAHGFGIIGCGMIAEYHTRAIHEIPAVTVVAVIGPLPEELVDDIAVRTVNLDTIAADFAGSTRAAAECFDDRVNVGLRHRAIETLRSFDRVDPADPVDEWLSPT